MFELELKKLKKRVKRVVYLRNLKDKDVFLFGVSDATRHIIKILRENDIEPKHVIDNDVRKQNSNCMRIKVIAPQDIEKGNRKKVIFLYSGYWREMVSQLKRMGYKKNEYIVLCPQNISLFAAFLGAIKGREIHKRLIKKYGDLKILLCPYTGTGDIYLIGTYWEQYCRKEQLDEYIFLVVSNACRKVASMFNIKNIEVLKKTDETAFLISYYMLCPENIDMKILNDSWPQIHTNRLEWLRGYKGLDFNEMFRRFVFDLPETQLPQHPQLKSADKEITHIFEGNELLEKQTIILSPYSNTLSDLPDEFWKILAKSFQDRGYVVCTNSSGQLEPPIEGTKGIFFPLDIAPQFISKAGVFIGVRSGFCDVISSSNAKKVVLYDADNWFYNCKAYDYFSLKKMRLCDDVLELNFKHGEYEKTIEEILEYVVKGDVSNESND